MADMQVEMYSTSLNIQDVQIKNQTTKTYYTIDGYYSKQKELVIWDS